MDAPETRACGAAEDERLDWKVGAVEPRGATIIAINEAGGSRSLSPAGSG